jgi:acyl CoA:acetate/3-ketoacid CoA transferase beta subunit
VVTQEECSYEEFLACLVSREIQDGGAAFVGAALPAIRAGTLLGHLLHGPNTRMLISMTTTNLYDTPVIDRFSFVTDWRGSRWAEHYRIVEDIFGNMRKMATWRGFFVGALQVDPFGNSNLLGRRASDGGFSLRGAGCVGTPSVTAVAASFNILVNRHDPSVFVEECDYVSAPGWIDGSTGARERLGLRGGPASVFSPLGTFDFHPETRRLRLHSLHPGVTAAQVREATGFELEARDDAPVTQLPTELELHTLRTRIDRLGELRKEGTTWPAST